jgi:hypothetical protein
MSVEYAAPDTVLSALDDDRVIVVDAAAGTAYRLTGVEALIWRYLSDSPDCPGLIDVLRRTLGATTPRADRVLRDILARWVGLGLLVTTPRGDHG